MLINVRTSGLQSSWDFSKMASTLGARDPITRIFWPMILSYLLDLSISTPYPDPINHLNFGRIWFFGVHFSYLKWFRNLSCLSAQCWTCFNVALHDIKVRGSKKCSFSESFIDTCNIIIYMRSSQMKHTSEFLDAVACHVWANVSNRLADRLTKIQAF